MADVPESVEKAFEERAAVEAQMFACHQRIAFLNGWIAAQDGGDIEGSAVRPARSAKKKM